jgi:drug/metabolite transporter (DMT)-like permease
MAFSWGFVLVKALALPPATIAGWRLLIGAAALSIAMLVARRASSGPLMPVLGAGLSFGLHQLAFISATHTTSIAVVTLIGALQPLLVALVSRRATGVRVRTALFLWSVVATAGVGLVVFAQPHEQSRSLLGDALAVVNLLLYSAFYLFSKRAREAGWSTLPLTRNTFAISLLVVAPVWLLTPALLPPGGREWGMLFALALLPGNGHLLVNWALPRVSAALGSLVLTAVPLLASLWAHLIFREPYGPRHLIGMALVAAAIEGARRSEAGSPPGSPDL